MNAMNIPQNDRREANLHPVPFPEHIFLSHEKLFDAKLGQNCRWQGDAESRLLTLSGAVTVGFQRRIHWDCENERSGPQFAGKHSVSSNINDVCLEYPSPCCFTYIHVI